MHFKPSLDARICNSRLPLLLIVLTLVVVGLAPATHARATCRCRPTSSTAPRSLQSEVKAVCRVCGNMFGSDTEYCCRCDNRLFAHCYTYIFETEEKGDFYYDYA